MIFRAWLSCLLLASLVTLSGCTENTNDSASGEIDPAQAPKSSAEPPSAVDAQDAVRRLHESLLVIDAHADIELPGKPSPYVGSDGLSRVAPEKLRAGGVGAVVMAVAVGPGPRDPAGVIAARATAEAELAAVQALVADPANGLVLATSADQVLAARDSGQAAVILGFQNARSFGTDPSGIDDFYQSGVRVFALTHMGHNDFADSSRPVYSGDTGTYEPDAEHGGLSALGKEAIARINALGGVVDVSQLSRQATLQVLDLTTAPVIASHSNVQALSDVRRNLSDEEIDGIGENGGVIHIAAFKGYLFDSNDRELDARIRAARREAGIPEDYDYPYELYWELPTQEAQRTFTGKVSEILGPGSIDDMLDHIDYVVARIGVEHVGIGNDFNHGGGIAGLNDASEASNLTAGLVERGYSEEDIALIWGGNFLRVFRAAEAAAD